MNGVDAKRMTMKWLRENSGLDSASRYLRMSQIGRCPAYLYQLMQSGNPASSDRAHSNCFSGYRWQAQVMEILTGSGVAKPMPLGPDGKPGDHYRELVAPFDLRFKGHTDAEAMDGKLIEIKTFGADDYRRVTRTGVIPPAYAWQVQAYLHYGNYRACLFVAVCRDPFEWHILDIGRRDQAAADVEAKAKLVLAAVDRGVMPECVCGQHRQEPARIVYRQTQTVHVAKSEEAGA